MKNRKVYVTTFCGVAVAMNIVLGIITSALGIPLYLDTLGTVLSAAILGPVPGIIVGALSNIITGLIYSVSDIPFCLVNMAVGLIVGSAFTAIVNSLVDDILMPVIGTVLVGINFSSLGITIPWGNHPFIAIGSFLNTIITFLLTALCVFLIVKTMNIFRRKQEEKPAPPKPSKEEQLLTEIRDLLAAQQGRPIQKDEKKNN